MAEQTDVHKLLVLHGPALQQRGVLQFLQEHFRVQVAQDMDAALEAMRRGGFDAVLAETADFLPLERGIIVQQASVVLDTIGDGVGVAGASGELVWANRRLRDFPAVVLDSLRNICLQAFRSLESEVEGDSARGKRFSLIPDDGAYYEVICSPVRDRQGKVQQVVAVVVNASSQRRQQLKLNAIDSAGRELVRLDYEALSRYDAMQRLRLLQDRIIRFSRDILQYKHFAVLLLDERTNRLEMIISEGLDQEAQKNELFASSEGNGICGYVAATGRSYICADATADARYLRGLRGARSSLTVPLRLYDKIIGVLNVESDRVGAFVEEDRQFAEIFANYVAMAMNILNLLVYERHSTHTQVSGSICAELAGPLNDVITEATELMEDYIGHDELRRRLTSIIDNASGARRSIQQLMQAPSTGMLNVPSGRVEKDPVLAGKSVLVADDEELIRNTIRDVLSTYGCYVDTACDGQQAIDMLALRRYDLVISDIKMPNATGYDVFAKARAICCETKVIFITAFGYDPHHSIVRANKEGLSSVLIKPFKAKQLLEECRRAVSSGKA